MYFIFVLWPKEVDDGAGREDDWWKIAIGLKSHVSVVYRDHNCSALKLE